MTESPLTSEAVHEAVKYCLFRNEEIENGAPKDPELLILAEGVVNKFGFNKTRIEEKAPEIRAMLAELPEGFMKGSEAGGHSFLQACMDRHGRHWGEHPTMDELFCLGRAINAVEWLMPREMWKILPGGMPYLVIDIAEA